VRSSIIMGFLLFICFVPPKKSIIVISFDGCSRMSCFTDSIQELSRSFYVICNDTSSCKKHPVDPYIGDSGQ